ncbi:MAG: acetate kinase [Microthrixaceae bacterium]
MTSSILVINAGSSSIKFQLIEVGSERVTRSGFVDRIGQELSAVRQVSSEGTVDREVKVRDHGEAMSIVLGDFEDSGASLRDPDLVAVGHRVVMGGRDLDRPVAIDDAVLARIEELSPLAPLHNPANAKAIRVTRKLLPQVPQVAVFDTAFFHDLPPEASSYAIDPALAERHSIRRYGFHGISHEYVSRTVAEMLSAAGHSNGDSGSARGGPGNGDPGSARGGDGTSHGSAGTADGLRQIVLHLGNGASASAVVNGRAVDVSMGFTPLEGLVMGTRSGDIDPSVAFYLNRQADMSIDDIDHLLNQRSGMLGLTGHIDLRDVHRSVAAGDRAAQLGLDMYVGRLRKYIGAYAAAMGGLDALTFTAGVGENDSKVRSQTVDRLGFLGITIDPTLNNLDSADPRVISDAGSRVKVLVVPTREELSIARQVADLIRPIN